MKKEVYKVRIFCTNCRFGGEFGVNKYMTFNKGELVSMQKCPKCNCKKLEVL